MHHLYTNKHCQKWTKMVRHIVIDPIKHSQRNPLPPKNLDNFRLTAKYCDNIFNILQRNQEYEYEIHKGQYDLMPKNYEIHTARERPF